MVNMQKVRDVMMSNFTKVDGVMKVSDALSMMREKKINALLVEPRDENDVYGIMTLKDIARKVIGKNRKFMNPMSTRSCRNRFCQSIQTCLSLMQQDF